MVEAKGRREAFKMATLREAERKALEECKEWTDTTRGVASKVLETSSVKRKATIDTW